jgi:tetratricopeptide (TPR) repeat protein
MTRLLVFLFLSFFALTLFAEENGSSKNSSGISSAKKEMSKPTASERMSPQIKLLISQGYNEVDSGHLDLALATFLQVIKVEPRSADAYLQIGFIYLMRDFFSVAVDYLEKAKTNQDYFLFDHQRADLYVHLASAYHQEKKYELEETTLKELLNFASKVTLNDAQESLYYKEAAGKGAFTLALFYQSKGEKVESRFYFEKSIELGYRIKTSYLYLIDWYAGQTEDDINAALLAYSKKTNESRYRFQPENRAVLLKRYIRRYDDAAVMDEAENRFLNDPSLLSKIKTARQLTVSLPTNERSAPGEDRQKTKDK